MATGQTPAHHGESWARVPRKGTGTGRCGTPNCGAKALSCLFSPSQVALGQHKEEYFSGPEPKAVLKKFREDTTGRGNHKCIGQEASASVTYLVATLRVQSTDFKWNGKVGLG